jgi:hypothetical protein
MNRRLILWVSGSIFLTSFAMAATTCVFQTNSTTKTMTLTRDCTTDTAILVPAGFTLNGASHLIQAVDPSGGNFVGPVVTNAAVDSTINVKNLAIDMPNLASGGCAFVQGIYFNQASGTISGNEILHVGQSGYCPDTGTGIQVTEGLYSTPQTVTISNNQVFLASAMALWISGPISATVTRNHFSINSLGSHVVEFAAKSGSFTQNEIETDPTTGVDTQIALEIYNNSSNLNISSNNINLISGATDIGIDLSGVNNPVTVTGNRIFSYGARLSGTGIADGPAANTISRNQIRCYATPIGGASATGNTILPCPF